MQMADTAVSQMSILVPCGANVSTQTSTHTVPDCSIQLLTCGCCVVIDSGVLNGRNPELHASTLWC